MDIECYNKEVRSTAKFVRTPYGDFNFSDVLRWLGGLIQSSYNSKAIQITDQRFVKLMIEEGIAVKARPDHHFLVDNVQKCSDMLMALRRNGMHSQGSTA